MGQRRILAKIWAQSYYGALSLNLQDIEEGESFKTKEEAEANAKEYAEDRVDFVKRNHAAKTKKNIELQNMYLNMLAERKAKAKLMYISKDEKKERKAARLLKKKSKQQHS